ncbi:AAA family ATPase [Candidatus Saccharibacteria bacterium]|nr:AAA family ATPase [Candidatus Saccharibacteria bacterium]
MGIKKQSITSLIRAHVERDDKAFRDEAYNIACDLSNEGDEIVSEYIISLLSDNVSLAPQFNYLLPDFFRILPQSSDPLYLPDVIADEIVAISKILNDEKTFLNKFLFVGAPGTGKTEAVKQLGRITGREILSVDFSTIIDSKLGQTAKNILRLFDCINTLSNQNRIIIVFDEIDAIALDRVNERDHREMGRATTEILQGLDNLSSNITIIATTNLKDHMDRALMRRFDMVVDFDRYTKNDLIDLAIKMLLKEIKDQHKSINSIEKVSRKIFNLVDDMPSPGELKNLIRVTVALSEKNNSSSLLSELIKRMAIKISIDEKQLSDVGFTLREIEQITGISKSSVSRRIKEHAKLN